MPTGGWCAQCRKCLHGRRFSGSRFLRHIPLDNHDEEEPVEDPCGGCRHAGAYLAVPLGAPQAPEVRH
eukprot:12555930-Heterocapsa_arctica.AAC.1